ncbi:MAG TPA: hypothetical protein VJ826_07505 [Candidatus Polarisedimenticolaceae bacterium]|nr:hypothetical protein [Candidatus Polarisedimenticolaceae bacterium]
MTVARVVALGASNLTRGFPTVVATARAAWGPDVEILAALGHGRSYGAPTRFLIRDIPGILQSGLWTELESRPPLPTRALVTDVGNDILYNVPVDQTLGWVEEAIRRLKRVTDDVVLTGLPLEGVRRIPEWKFAAMRKTLAPSCRLTLAQAVDAAERVHAGLVEMAAATGVTFLALDPAWYGFDPIHVRPSLWRPAWQTILGADKAGASMSWWESVRLYLMPQERRSLFGRERITPQSGARSSSGGRLWLY